MKKLIQKMSKAVQVLLAAPVKLPAKVVQVVKYVALALGVLETVLPSNTEKQKEKEDSGEAAD